MRRYFDTIGDPRWHVRGEYADATDEGEGMRAYLVTYTDTGPTREYVLCRPSWTLPDGRGVWRMSYPPPGAMRDAVVDDLAKVFGLVVIATWDNDWVGLGYPGCPLGAPRAQPTGAYPYEYDLVSFVDVEQLPVRADVGAELEADRAAQDDAAPLVVPAHRLPH